MSTSRLGAAPKPASADDEGFKRELVLLIPHLRAFARTLTGDATAADDLAQDAMMKAWDARASYQMGTNMKAWTFMILRNQFYSEKRRSWRQSQLDQEAAERTLVAVDDPEALKVFRAEAFIPAVDSDVDRVRNWIDAIGAANPDAIPPSQ